MNRSGLVVAGAWGGLTLGAWLWPVQALPWMGAMALPVAGAGFLWGPRGAWILAAASSLVGVGLILRAVPVGWMAGPWTVLALLPLLIWVRGRQLRMEGLRLEAEQAACRGEVARLQADRQHQRSILQTTETAIHQISELYGLSKQFLATLDLKEALQMTEEALMRWLPQVNELQRSTYLAKVQSLVDEGGVSVEALIQAIPLEGIDPATREKWGMVSGQLALGLQRICLYRQVQESATQDGLTGLLVRRTFRERLEEELSRALRRGAWLTFLMIDLDRFKQVNDTYGHLVGDVVLREVAHRIRSSVREIDSVGRYGGEEFGVILPESDEAFGIQVADRIRLTIEAAPIPAYDEQVPMTVSVGVSLCPRQASTAEQLIELADQALYRAKGEGRNRTVAAP